LIRSVARDLTWPVRAGQDDDLEDQANDLLDRAQSLAEGA
jgi:hypothetical protein